MQIAIVLAVLAVAANLFFMWYAKKCNQAKADESKNPKNGTDPFSKEYLNTPEVVQLKERAADEMGLSIEELDLMLAKEIKQLSKKQESIDIG